MDDDSGWPNLVICKDFNGDKAEDLIMGKAYTEMTYPIVYSWGKDGLSKVFQSEVEFWQGL